MKIIKISFFLLVFGITLIFLYFEKNLSWLYLGLSLMFYLLSSAVHMIAHEIGHLMGGLFSGYKLLFLQFGPINIKNKNNKVIIKFKKELFGQCIMIPKQIENIRFFAYNAGGIIANVLIVILSLFLLFFNTFSVDLLVLELVCIGVQKIFVNMIPHINNLIPNDGYIIKILNKNEFIQKDYAMYLILYGKLFLNEDIVIQDFMYESETYSSESEKLYYNEIQYILREIEQNKNRV